MGHRLGIIAGSGEFPFFLLKEAQKRGYACAVAAVKGEADASIQDKAPLVTWIDVSDMPGLVGFFKKEEIREVVFAGKIEHKRIFSTKMEKTLLRHLPRLKNKTPSALISGVILFLENMGFEVNDPTPFLERAFCEDGVLSETFPTAEMEEDISLGQEIALKLADWDIGQTVVVKEKVVIAVEAMEGTDETIKRGGYFAGKGTVVVKLGRSIQDPRIDLPALGLKTVESLVEAESKALCFEARKIPFFQQEEAVALANAHNISILARSFD